MDYLQKIRAAHSDPKGLEDLYQTALRENKVEEFTADLLACHQESPENVLYTAWYYRLQPIPSAEPAVRKGPNWKLAIPLSVAAGLILWLLTDRRLSFPGGTPFFLIAWAPIEACFVIAFLGMTARKPLQRALPIFLGLVSFSIYAGVFTWLRGREQYKLLAILHLPLWAWIGVGLYILGLQSDYKNRFAFLTKSIEVFITVGIFVAAGGAFSSITLGLFQVLGISLSEIVMRLLVAGGGGTIPVLAVASAYDPHLSPAMQQFEQGLSRLISTMMRLLLPLTLLVLFVYLLVIPFNFMAPFRSRELLIVYNAMLFAIMGLLIGATPVYESDLALKYGKPLRTGILILAVLAVLVSVYALSATVYRTLQGTITPNRLTVIGWNSINIGILGLFIYRQLRHSREQWIHDVQSAIGVGAMAYIAWTVLLIVALPLFFR